VPASKIGDDFTFVGTEAELNSVFPGDVKLGDDAVILLVSPGAEWAERQAMADKAVAIRAGEVT